MSNERVSPFHCPGPEMVNKNLLINAYFKTPVWQRNSSYIDMWIYGSYAMTDDGILFTDDTYHYALQKLEQSLITALKGQLLTASALLSDGTFISGSSIYNPDSITYFALNGNTIQLLCIQGGHFEIWCGGDSAVTVLAVKLELGPVQTLAHLDATGKWVLNEIPNYVEELNKCRYYYRVFDTEAQRTANNWGMRLANPTQGTISIDGATKYTLDANL